MSTENTDWRISDKQRMMIIDKIAKMSKKEAALLIRIIEAIFQNRTSELQKLQGNQS